MVLSSIYIEKPILSPRLCIYIHMIALGLVIERLACWRGWEYNDPPLMRKPLCPPDRWEADLPPNSCLSPAAGCAYVHHNQNQSHHHHSLLTCNKTKITTVCLHCMHHNQNYHRLQGAPKLKPPPQGLSPKPPPQFAWMQQLRNHSEYHHHHSSSFYKLEALISAYWLMPQSCKFVSKWILSIQMFSDFADKPSKTRLHNTSQPRRERICNC